MAQAHSRDKTVRITLVPLPRQRKQQQGSDRDPDQEARRARNTQRICRDLRKAQK
jgi:hypothetical protein